LSILFLFNSSMNILSILFLFNSSMNIWITPMRLW
jgi:hypothetical protein